MNKNLQLTLAWFALAFLVTLAAVWQAQVTVAREVIARNQLPPPPPKTRRAVRPVAPVAPPAVDYAARKVQGLTDSQIGWIIDDFQTAGLDLGIRVASKEEYLVQRKAQDRWYHDALVEAWALTPEQSAQVTTKLGELYDRAKADFIEALAAGPQPIKVNGQWLIVTSSDPIHRLIDANIRFQDFDGPFMPWKLCEMTSEQNPTQAGKPIDIKITGVPGQEYEEVVLTRPIQIMPPEPTLFMVNHLLPRPIPPPAGEPIQVVPEENAILPQLRKLHPAQFKLLLLIDPGKIRGIQSALDAN